MLKITSKVFSGGKKRGEKCWIWGVIVLGTYSMILNKRKWKEVTLRRGSMYGTRRTFKAIFKGYVTGQREQGWVVGEEKARTLCGLGLSKRREILNKVTSYSGGP